MINIKNNGKATAETGNSKRGVWAGAFSVMFILHLAMSIASYQENKQTKMISSGLNSIVMIVFATIYFTKKEEN